MTPRLFQARFASMGAIRMARDVARILAGDPQLAYDFYCMASEIVDDFEEWGPVLQANEDGHYDETTTIMKLKALRDQLRTALRP